MAKEKRQRLNESYTISRIDPLIDTAKEMLDDAKKEELPIQPAQSEKQDERED